MRTVTAFLGIATAVATTALAHDAGATNYSLWLHGRYNGVPSGWNYWVNGSGNNIAAGVGVNAVPVDFDGSQHISVSNPTVQTFLNAYCTGGNACYIQCHSAGCAEMGYAEAYHPGAWNINWIFAGGSAAGGSELAGNTAYFFSGLPIDLDLPVNSMRNLYNHDVIGDSIAGIQYTSLGGDYSSLTTCIFYGGCVGGKGENDSAVSWQSSGHFRNAGTYNSDTANGAKGGTYWDATWLWLADKKTYGHCVKSAYPCNEGAAGGIMSVVATAAAQNNH